MAKLMNREGSPMKLWTIILGALVVIMVIVVAVLASQLDGTKSEFDDSEQQVASLKGQVDGLQGSLSSTQGKLTTAEGKSASLQTDLTGARTQVDALNGNVASQQKTIDQQSGQIKTMKYPRHFNSLIELTNWLQKDDTNTRYAGLSSPQLSFIIEIRASRDGYLLPVRLPLAGSLEYITNMAVIGDVMYSVRGTDDFVERWGTISPAPPSYPILPDSGQ